MAIYTVNLSEIIHLSEARGDIGGWGYHYWGWNWGGNLYRKFDIVRKLVTELLLKDAVSWNAILSLIESFTIADQEASTPIKHLIDELLLFDGDVWSTAKKLGEDTELIDSLKLSITFKPFSEVLLFSEVLTQTPILNLLETLNVKDIIDRISQKVLEDILSINAQYRINPTKVILEILELVDKIDLSGKILSRRFKEDLKIWSTDIDTILRKILEDILDIDAQYRINPTKAISEILEVIDKIDLSGKILSRRFKEDLKIWSTVGFKEPGPTAETIFEVLELTVKILKLTGWIETWRDE